MLPVTFVRYGLALYFSYSSVWRLVSGIARPLINKCFN